MLASVHTSRARASGVLIALAVVLALGLFAAMGPIYLVQLATLVFILAIASLGANLLLGYAGRVSFGQASFFGAAAYAVGIATVRYGLSPGIAVVIALGITLALGVLFGLLTLRGRGVYFLLITLALGQVVWGVAYRWVSMTGGDNGLPGIPRPQGTLIWPLADDRGFFVLTAIVFATVLAFMYLFTESPMGYALRGIRESESRMRTLGYPVEVYHQVAFVVAALYAGVGGVLYAFYNGFVSPLDLHVTFSSKIVLSVILGGTGTLLGPLVGMGLIVFLENFLSGVTQRWMLMLGLLYIGTVLFTPDGVLGLGKLWRARQKQTGGHSDR